MVGRFQVMALSQVARAKALGYPLDEAESFGLNRAIFYVAAKKKRYMMGEEILEPDDFRRRVAERFGQAFPRSWEQAVQMTDRAALEARCKFNEKVYKPRRDELATAWSALSKQAR